MIEGTIEVERVRDVLLRQRRQLEWWYLKEYWKASKEDKSVVLALYGTVLSEALAKWRSRYKVGY